MAAAPSVSSVSSNSEDESMTAFYDFLKIIIYIHPAPEPCVIRQIKVGTKISLNPASYYDVSDNHHNSAVHLKGYS
jgi:hypothetical protein